MPDIISELQRQRDELASNIQSHQGSIDTLTPQLAAIDAVLADMKRDDQTKAMYASTMVQTGTISVLTPAEVPTPAPAITPSPLTP